MLMMINGLNVEEGEKELFPFVSVRKGRLSEGREMQEGEEEDKRSN
jgi:hypothetical protein